MSAKPAAPQKIKMVCDHCGSEDIRRDAFASWNVETQEWELASIFDNTICDACGEDNCAEEVPVFIETEGPTVANTATVTQGADVRALTPELIDRCAQRLASWNDGNVWPDSWEPWQVLRLRTDAERVLREAGFREPSR
jgi:hypothetical protein